MSLGTDHDIDGLVLTALQSVPLLNADGQHFGRPFVSSYQLAIALDAEEPNLATALDMQIGGRGTGTNKSMAQYIGRELSRRIEAAGDSHYAEGAFMSSLHVESIHYRRPVGPPVISSLPGTPYDVAVFRLRSQSGPEA